ncbi:hypothetical protein F5Y09DRAFT_334238 [Xylaria sp. FL1042]|nr:hypothetical protein F5Y09DRAFT_334238 [Xylaria sp. FL1042]
MIRDTIVRTASKYRPRTKTVRPEAQNAVRQDFLHACRGTGDTQDNLERSLDMFVDLVEDRMLNYKNATAEVLEILWRNSPEPSYLERYTTFTSATADILTTIGDNNPLKLAPDRYSTDSSRRPVGVLLRSHGLIPIGCPPGMDLSHGSPTLLAVTHLNFFTLSRLGDVTISWVDDLSKHCHFDRYSKKKELKLFRLPSLCSTICLRGGQDMLMNQLFKHHGCQEQRCRSGSEMLARSHLIEVLLSYRLLFGQHSRSRQFFRDSERERAKFQGRIDPLLDALCSEVEMKEFSGTRGLLRERGVYNTNINFPHLGGQLVELADYSTSQRPRNLIEVWNDGRDPEKLLTFKAVIIFGLASICLTVLQVFIGIVQVIVAYVTR